ncbi:hypothetical protein M0802_004413 [Mischocyttarus mexicanus]|nr:hypothetical protein M0802_004413 [Mischocyttarus mexicanus]
MSQKVKNDKENLDHEEIILPPIRTPGPIQIWKTIDGFKTVGDESKSVRIVIQEIPEDRYEDILDHMCTYFIVDEPCCSCVKIIEDPSAVKEFRDVWRIILKQGLSIGAFVEDPKGGKPEIAGTNIIGIKTIPTKKVIEPVTSMCKEAKIYEYYNTDRYMYAFGLSVHPFYRGHNLGVHILSAREQIGRKYNVPVTATAFTSAISQKSAARCGYEVILARDYDQMLDKEGKLMFPTIKFKTFKVMGRRLY